MATRLTEAMEEAYASNPSSVVILHAIEVNHGTFPEPIRVVSGDHGPPDGDEEGLVYLGVDGTMIPFVAMAYEVIPPGYDDDGPTPGRLRLSSVSGELLPYLEEAARNAGPIMVTYRGYRSDDRSEPGDVISGLRLRAVDVDAIEAQGEIGFDEVGRQNFPRITYSIEHYPGLFLGN